MVANDNGELIVSSATQSDNYYNVNISTLQATAVRKKEDKVFNCSDLANSNLLYQDKGGISDKFVINELKGNREVSIYPNPVISKTFSVQFDKVPNGKYNLVLTDASGRSVLSRGLTVNINGQIEKIVLPRASAGGMYMVKLSGADGQVVYNDKIVVQ